MEDGRVELCLSLFHSTVLVLRTRGRPELWHGLTALAMASKYAALFFLLSASALVQLELRLN